MMAIASQLGILKTSLKTTTPYCSIPKNDQRLVLMKPIQRFLAVAGAISFFGSTAFATTRIFRDIWNQPEQSTATETANPQEQLLSQERGYLKVLEREPKNQVALEGLVNTRIQLNQLESSLEPLKVLIETYPEKEDYKLVYSEIEKAIQASQTAPTAPSPSPIYRN